MNSTKEQIKAVTLDYCLRYGVFPGWYKILHRHVHKVMESCEGFSLFINEESGHLRVDTCIYGLAGRGLFGRCEPEVWNDSGRTCPCCGVLCRDKQAVSLRTSLCSRCVEMDDDGRHEKAFETFRRWLLTE